MSDFSRDLQAQKLIISGKKIFRMKYEVPRNTGAAAHAVYKQPRQQAREITTCYAFSLSNASYGKWNFPNGSLSARLKERIIAVKLFFHPVRRRKMPPIIEILIDQARALQSGFSLQAFKYFGVTSKASLHIRILGCWN